MKKKHVTLLTETNETKGVLIYKDFSLFSSKLLLIKINEALDSLGFTIQVQCDSTADDNNSITFSIIIFDVNYDKTGDIVYTEIGHLEFCDKFIHLKDEPLLFECMVECIEPHYKARFYNEALPLIKNVIDNF